MAKVASNQEAKINYNNQSEIIEGDVRTCSKSENDEFDKKCSQIEIRSLDQVLYMGLKESNDGPCLGSLNESSNAYNWLKYSEVINKIKNLASGLRYLALTAGERYSFGIWISNGINALIAELACYAGGLIVVPLDDQLTPRECASIVTDLNIGCIIIDNNEKAQAVISQAYNQKSLKYVIAMNSILESYRSKAISFGLIIKTCEEVHELGENDPVPFEIVKDLDQVSMIVFTGGSVGEPKKVAISHKGLLYTALGIDIRLGNHRITKSDNLFSYLPRSHLDQKCFELLTLMVGGRIGFASKITTRAWKEAKMCRPTILIILPKLVKILKDKLLLTVRGSKIREWLLRRSLSMPLNCKNINNDAILKHLRSKMGSRIRLIISTTSLIPRDLTSFLKISLGCKVCTCYGLKELSGPCTLTYPDDESIEHVGVPLPCVQIRVTNQNSYDGICGEIAIKKFAVQTELPPINGSISPCRSVDCVWIRTDDVGFWRSNGTLELIGHQMEIFFNCDHKLISTERIESILMQSQFVEDIFVHHNSDHELIAIIYPNITMTKVWCCENHIRGSFAELCANKKVKEEIVSDLRRIGRKYGFQAYEHPKTVHISNKPFVGQLILVNSVIQNRRINCKKHFMNITTSTG